MPLKIAITGGIGSGKSRVCRWLAGYCGVLVLDLDQICRRLLEPGGQGLIALTSSFGGRFLDRNRQLDRKRLRQVLFSDALVREKVDAILHPLARRQLHKELRMAGDSPVLIEIPLLFEAGWQADADAVVVVYATEQERVRRIMARDRVTREDARLAIAAGFPLADKALQATHVLDNSGPWSNTCLEMLHLAGMLGLSSSCPTGRPPGATESEKQQRVGEIS